MLRLTLNCGLDFSSNNAKLMSVDSANDLNRTMLCSHLEFYFVPKEAVIVQKRVLLDILLKLLGTSGSSTRATRSLESRSREGSWTVRGSGSPALDGFWSALHESRLARRRTGFGRVVCRAMLYFPVLGHRIHSRSTYAVFNPPLLDEPCRVSTYSCWVQAGRQEWVRIQSSTFIRHQTGTE